MCIPNLLTFYLQILNFFQEKSTDLHILEKYASIKNLFLKYNTPLPSSAAVERLFSYATMTNSPKCNKHSDAMFQKRVILKANLNNGKGN